MTYQKTIPLPGDPAKALEAMRMVFMQQGFRLVQSDRTSLEVVGPGWQNNHQDALRGISRAFVTAEGRELTLEADLGAARNMMRFIRIFPPALCLGLFILFFCLDRLISGKAAGPGIKIAAIVCGANMALWVPIGLIWAPAIRRATIKAINTLLENAATVSRQ